LKRVSLRLFKRTKVLGRVMWGWNQQKIIHESRYLLREDGEKKTLNSLGEVGLLFE